MRQPALLMAAALALGVVLQVVGPMPAEADGDTWQNLVERAGAVLQEAEAHYLAGRRRPAGDLARRASLLVQQADRLRPRERATALLAVQAAVFAEDRAAGRIWLARYAERTPYGERDPELHYARALVRLFLENRPGEAVAALERMQVLPPRVRTRPRELLYYAALMADAERRLRRGDLDGAVQGFRKAVVVARRLGERRKELAARGNVGIALQHFERHEECLGVFEGLREEDARNALWPWYLGRSLQHLERWDDAVAAYRRVGQLYAEGLVNPAHASMLWEAHYHRAECLEQVAAEGAGPVERTEALREARRALKRYVERAAESAKGHYALGRLLDDRFQEPYEAMKHLKRAYEIDPVCDAALRRLIRIAARVGPPPGNGSAATEEARRAWVRQREAWERALEKHGDEWARAREERRRRAPDGSDGCP